MGDDESGNTFDTTEQISSDWARALHNRDAQLYLTYQGRVSVFSPKPQVFVVGRNDDCDIVVDDKLSSRNHAHIAYRMGKFVIIDHSTNGTFVNIGDNAEIRLGVQEQSPLTGQGSIGLGRTTTVKSEHLIQFCCKYGSDPD